MTETTTEAVIRLLSEARGIPEMAAGMVLDFDEIDALIALAVERDALAARVAELEAERASALEAHEAGVEHWKGVAGKLDASVAELQAENARLRRSRDRYREEWEHAKAHQEIAATRAVTRAALQKDKTDD